MDVGDDLLRRMEAAATSRAAMWSLCAQIIDRPTPEFNAQLRDGRLARELETHTQWLGESVDVAELAATLRAHRNRSSNVTAEQDLENLQEEWDARDDAAELADYCRNAAAAARQEASWWGTGDTASARDARAQQHVALAPMVEAFTQWCITTDTTTQLLIVQVLAEVVALQVGLEAGCDVRSRLHTDARRRLVFGG